MDITLKKQVVTKGYIDRFWENLIKVGEDKVTQSYLKTRLTLLESYWQRFEETHYNLLENDDPAVKKYLKDDVYADTEDNYVAVKTKITSLLRDDTTSVKHDPTSATTSFFKQIQLPKISLPSFSGDQLAWESFRDLFKSLVGDVSELAPVQKLQYLKASLSGEAAAAVANVELNDKGYEAAWSELVTRYDNKRVLLATHMRAFINSASISKPSSSELKRLSSTALQARRSFESLRRPVVHWNDWFVHVLVEKLDPSSRLFWEASLETSSEFPTLDQLQDFLQTRIRALDAANFKASSVSTSSAKVHERKGKVNSLTATAAGSSKAAERCSCCQGNHLFNYCPRFKELSVPQRREHAKKQGACFNCLKLKHTVSNCPSGLRCLRCQAKHHTLLHLSDTSSTSNSDPPDQSDGSAATGSEPSSSSVASNVAALAVSSGGPVLLSTALVTCSNNQGNTLVARALLDSGSEASFLSERFAQKLRLPKRRVHVPVAGIQSASSGVVAHSVALTIGSPRDPGMRLHVPSVLVLPKLTSVLPSRRVQRCEWPHLDGLELADPYYDRPASVDAILGADVYGLLLREGLKPGPQGTPSAQATALGWVLMGHTAALPAESDMSSVSALHVAVSSADVDQALQRFWELEEVSKDAILSPDDLQCESLYTTTHSRNSRGRYTVRLPRRRDTCVPLGNNRNEALRMLVGLERRLMRNPPLREQYVTFMSEYQSLDHMSLVPTSEIGSDGAYYLPHHAVFKSADPAGKIRVVFNASHRTYTGFSLNDLLLPGPKLQSELWLILTRWRLFRYAFVTDIIKMFRQILVHREDIDLQRILWRPDPSMEVQDFRLKTVVYGTTSAPYLALRTLLQLADDERSAFPLGADALKAHSYVDDILAGGHSLDHALETRRQLLEILSAGGFELSRWAANASELCPDEESSDKLFHDRDGVSTLGVLWSPCDDSFALRVAADTSATANTKRLVLSEVARFFDPLGWAAPVLVFGKIFIQDLWMAGLSWDQPLPDQLQSVWTRFADVLPQLNILKIPRFVGYFGLEGSIELHGFADASSRAYAAAVYLRCTGATGDVTVRLLVAKTKVAPVKRVSIPRLELCGALLLARLMRNTATGLGLENAPSFAWTDAAVALAWIRSHPARWKTFVAHRVAEIQTLVPPERWRYVPTTDNPADAATRGLSPTELANLDLWWLGPSWLGHSDYSSFKPSQPVVEAEEEELRVVVTHLARPKEENEILHRFSSMLRLLRVSAFCFRFIHNSRYLQNRRTGFLTTDELDAARTRWVRIAQRHDFPEETSRLEGKQPLLARSPLLALRPIMDGKGLMRVGGRLQHALLPFAEKHPLILAKTNHLSWLLVREAHAASLHGGPQLTRSLLLRRYWILHANALVRSVIHACVRCARFRAATAEQQMGQLPAERTQPSRPFLSSGVDYAGPVPLRTSKGRGHKTVKGYICLFVCLSSKAIHLEPVSDLSSASFLAAFRRFTSRRGHCRLLLSDNGTNFRGAARELRDMFRGASEFYHECAASLANTCTTWRFIPPGAPHFGGLWEAGVKAVKYHLRRVIGDASLTYEEMATLLTQIEACLNSRPLYALSSNPTDLAALTPGHLLIGEPPMNIPEPSLEDHDANRLPTRWALTSVMRDHFWRRWSAEYVHHLQQLRKWTKLSTNLAVGDLVLLKNELQPPTKWALARVTALHPGSDGLVRVVSVKTAATMLKRPISKLVPLPVEPSSSHKDND